MRRFGKTQRAEIVRSICAEGAIRSISEFGLTDEEERIFRRECQQSIDRLCSTSYVTKGLRRWKKVKPFFPVVITVVAIVAACGFAGWQLLSKFDPANDKTFVFASAAATVGAVAAAAIGWLVAGWVSHRNAVVQHTINLIFARVSQPTFADNVFAFNKAFGNDLSPRLFLSDISRLETSKSDDDKKSAQSAKYILNYFEFIAAGITRGDLDLKYVELTLKSQIKFYYDKCEPFIMEIRQTTPSALENLTELRDHFRFPPD